MLEPSEPVRNWTLTYSNWRHLLSFDEHDRNAVDTVAAARIAVDTGQRTLTSVTLRRLCDEAHHNGIWLVVVVWTESAELIARRLVYAGSVRRGLEHEAVVEATDPAFLHAVVSGFDPELTVSFEQHLWARLRYRVSSQHRGQSRRSNIIGRAIGRAPSQRPGVQQLPTWAAQRLDSRPLPGGGADDPAQRAVDAEQLRRVRAELGDDQIDELLDYRDHVGPPRPPAERTRISRLRAIARNAADDS